MSHSDLPYIRRVCIALTLLTLLLLLWTLRDVLLLAFGSVLVAVILRSLAAPAEHYAGLSSRWSLVAAGAAIILLTTLAFIIAGSAVRGQIDELSQRIPEAWHNAVDYLQGSRIGSYLTDLPQTLANGTGMLSGLSRATALIIGSVFDVLLVLFGGIYLAARPQFYIIGVLKLFPRSVRGKVGETLEACGRGLRLWLKGQLLSMLVVGTLITLGLWLIGLPSALALGLLAGLGEFVPIIGTLFAAVPALLLAFAQDTTMMLWTLGVYIAVQQVQGNIIMPLIQQRMVFLPPALMLFALMTLTLLFGVAGTFLAAPITVVAYIAVKKLYVQGALGEDTPIPGEAR